MGQPTRFVEHVVVPLELFQFSREFSNGPKTCVLQGRCESAVAIKDSAYAKIELRNLHDRLLEGAIESLKPNNRLQCAAK